MAIDLLSNCLDKKLIKQIDFTTLKKENTSYLTPKLKESFSDLVFSCKTQGKSFLLSFLIEHKSFVPKNPHVQLLNYMSHIWQEQEKKNIKLNHILPIYVYHGKEKWSKRKFKDSFNKIDFFNSYTPSFDYALIDLSKFSDNQIQTMFNEIFVRVSLLLLKNYFDETVLNLKLNEYLSNLRVNNSNSYDNFIKSTVVYLINGTNINEEKIIDIFNNVSQKGGEIAMTTAERLIERGRNEGIQKGIEKGIQKGIEKGIEKGIQKGIQKGIEKGEKNLILKLYFTQEFSIEKIATLLEIDIKEVEKYINEEDTTSK
jgi:predicted transposase/invertase (TIGR01784 family)